LTIETLVSIGSGVFPILAYLFSKTKKSTSSHIVFAFVVLSVSIDSICFYYSMIAKNNLFLLNIYDYIAVFLELFFFLSVLKFKRSYVTITSIVLFSLWTAHAVYNRNHGFFKYSAPLTFAGALTTCIYCALTTLIILMEGGIHFKQLNFLFLAILGFFVFESLSLIPVSTLNLNINSFDRKHLTELYSLIVGIAGVLRNLLFTIYFIAENRMQKQRIL
jgi:hypothetical protein